MAVPEFGKPLRVWECKVGFADNLPIGADDVMREAVVNAYQRLNRQNPDFVFSGWGGELTETELEVITQENQSK